MGRAFSLPRLLRLSDLSQDALLAGLDEALNAHLITPIPELAGRYRFVHDLVRETLYKELPLADRVRLHQRIGAMLEELHAANLEPYLAELSHHFSQAAPVGEVDKAIGYTLRAAGPQVLVPGLWLQRLANGRIVESWQVWDTLGMLQQLGVIPTPEEVSA